MRIVFVADGRSPIALNWIAYFVEAGHEVHLASTSPCEPALALASLHLAPVAFGAVGGWRTGEPGRQRSLGKTLRRLSSPRLRTALRQWLGPLTLGGAADKLRGVVEEIRPDLVHAMRIPFEGMLAALADPQAPLLVSVWGNDFTLHAPSTPLMRRHTRRTAARADALHADCRRDLRLAREWGFAEGKPSIVLPGGGGVQPQVFYPSPTPPGEPPVVINPRGMRAYVRNDVFFQAIPRVLARRPEVRFVCPAMAGEPRAERWVRELGIARLVELLPRQSRAQMADLFRGAQVAVSPSTHDGTPNTLLEAMACGCLPLAGDIESLREWIEPGVNGLLVDPGDPEALAGAILRALKDGELRARAAEHNARLIAERATYEKVMPRAEAFYRQIAGSGS